jgi:aspartyl-tRNA(Asn)/glutamyl-tRNA(Gln) amidotransferase subunit A
MAAAAFADALARLAQARPPGRTPLPLRYVPPDAPPRRAPVPVETAGGGGGPLLDALDAQRAGKVSSVELVTGCLGIIDDLDGGLHGMAWVDREGALAAADAADDARRADRWLGPLHGIPITVKDVIDVTGMPTRAGSAAYEDRPTVDAVAVARLRAAGAVIIGKATTHEFALGVTSPQSRNPHDTTRLPGGSSGGSAISVATGMALGSLGTDTRASIRVPAALSGVVGFKPTIGSFPTDGVLTLSWTMDHVAPMAATVGDVAALLEALLGQPLTTTGPDPRSGLRLGVPDATFVGVEPGVADAVDAALRTLAGQGMELVSVNRPSAEDLDLANAAGLVVSRVEAVAAHRSLDLDRSLYWEEVDDQLRLASDISGIDYVDAQRVRGLLAAQLLRAFDRADVLVMPTVGCVAPPAQDFARYLMVLSRNAIPWSFTGFPAVSIPCGWVGGLPVGLQIVAPPGADGFLVDVALSAERALARGHDGQRGGLQVSD